MNPLNNEVINPFQPIFDIDAPQHMLYTYLISTDIFHIILVLKQLNMSFKYNFLL